MRYGREKIGLIHKSILIIGFNIVTPCHSGFDWPFGEVCEYKGCSYRYTYCGSTSHEKRDIHKKEFHPDPDPTIIQQALNAFDYIDNLNESRIDSILNKMDFLSGRIDKRGRKLGSYLWGKEHQE